MICDASSSRPEVVRPPHPPSPSPRRAVPGAVRAEELRRPVPSNPLSTVRACGSP